MKDWLEQAGERLKGNGLAGKLVIGLGLLGMALILCAELFATSGNDNTVVDATEGSGVILIDGGASEGVTTVAISTEESYRAALEENLSALVSQLDGAGQAVVMITLISGEETVYAQNVTTSETQTSESHVLLDDGSALSEMVLTPTVCGVVVLCEGGDSVIVEAKITAMVTALFDISSNHVSVEKLA